MPERGLIVEFRYTPELAQMAANAKIDPTAGLNTAAVPDVAGVTFDDGYAPVGMPRREPLEQAESIFNLDPFTIDVEPEAQTYLLRGEVEDESQIENLRSVPAVVQAFADVT